MDDAQRSSVTLIVREGSNNSLLVKTEEESTINKGKIDTLSSNPGSQRGDNSYISPTVNAIYAEEYPVDVVVPIKDK
jgi:hypothetical protein